MPESMYQSGDIRQRITKSYPNFEENLAEKENYVISKVSGSQPVFGKRHLREARSHKLTTRISSKEIRIIYYIADLPVTRLRLLTNKSDNIAVPYASLWSLILLLSSFSFAFLTRFYKAPGMLDSVSHKKIKLT